MKTSHLIDIRTITSDGPTVHLTATPAERQELQERFDVPRIDRLELTGTFGQDDFITFDGMLTADLERICVVTLNPFTTSMKKTVHVLFSDSDQDAEDNPDIDILPIQKGKIDLWHLLAEEFGLSLDPFPKSTDGWLDYRDPTDTEPTNPFAVLKKHLKK